MSWNVEPFGVTKEGESIERFNAISDDGGIEVSVINYGGIITAVKTLDKFGNKEDIVPGFDNIKDYENEHPYFGAIIGRFANRVAKGQFTLEGKTYQLTVNNGPNHLHGGAIGFDKKVWTANVDGSRLRMSYVSPHNEEGYPGQLEVCVCYEIQAGNTLVIDFVAQTSKPTILNLTSHSYFNLAGHKSSGINDHMIQIYAEKFTPKDSNDIPTGELADVSATLFDLRQPVRIGDRLPDIPGGRGYDHNFCVSGDGQKKHAASLYEESSGRTLDLYSTQPGLQLYTGHFFPGCKGKDDAFYTPYSSMALEAQNYPNAINQPSFPSCALKPGETYHHTTWYTFSTKA